jgi:hypothetical protein
VTTTTNRALFRALAALTAALAASLSVATAASAHTGTGAGETGPATANSGIALSTSPTSTTTTYDSPHWAGYTFPVGHVTGIRADWTEPRVTGKKGDMEFVWLGVGGFGAKDDNIIQEGTFAYFPRNGQRNEGIWYELVPNFFARYAGVPVGPGNRIQASITLLSAKTHTWQVAMVDATTGARFSLKLTFKSLEEFPSFIVEDPAKGTLSANGPFFPLPRWTPVTFTHIGIRVGSRWLGAAQLSRWYRINMVRGRDTLATVGALSRQSSFTVTQR